MNEPTATAPNPYAPSQPVTNAVPPSPAASLPLDGEIRTLFDRGQKGAGWFFWIAALSLVNSIMALTGGGFGFALGLGVTMVADAFGLAAAQNGAGVSAQGIAFVFDLVIYALVVGCGYLSRKRVLPVFALGMFLYLLDGLIYILFFDLVSIVIHVVALANMWSGFTAYRKLNELERSMLLSAAGAP